MATNPLASGDTAYLYRAAIGPRSDYYLRHFARFDGDGKAGTSWNWAAYWTTFNWLIYRKMWGWAIAYVAALLGLALLVFGVGKLVLNYSDTSAILLSLLLLTAAFVLPGIYANSWFYSHCNDKISAVLRETPDIKQAATVLAADAPGNRSLIVQASVNAVLAGIVALLAHGLQSAESGLPQIAAREERASASTGGQVEQARPAPAPVAAASAPAVVASAPAATPEPAAKAPVLAASAPAAAPVVAAAPVIPAAPAKPAAVAVTKPPMINAADRPAAAPSRPEPAVAPRARAAEVEPAVVARPTPVPAVAPRPAAAASAPAALRYVWVIQVGAYAQEENARKALAQVQSLGLDAGAESFETSKGPLMRVRVGPFMRQAEADQAALRIKSLNLPVLVLR